MKRLALATLLLLSVLGGYAQWDDEYKMEIGAGVGTLSYKGDFNGSLGKNLQPMATVVLRRVFNPYMDLAANLSYGTLSGDPKDVETKYPKAEELQSFSNKLVDFGLRYEYNFWPYGTGHDYRGARRITPFIFLGLGATYADTAEGSKFTGNFPIGAGVKFKIATRLNLGVEWAMHFTWSDELDGVADPYGIKSSGLFKNTDGYSALQVSLTYSFLPKCKTCNKDRDD